MTEVAEGFPLISAKKNKDKLLLKKRRLKETNEAVDDNKALEKGDKTVIS